MNSSQVVNSSASAALFQSSKLAQRISSSRPKGGRRRITANDSKANLEKTLNNNSQERFFGGSASQMSQTYRNLRGSVDIKKRQQSSNKGGGGMVQNFIEYRPGAFKEAQARIKTARGVRENGGEGDLLKLNEEEPDEELNLDDKQMMSSISSPRN